MSISSAMNSGKSGLNAQGTKFGTISDNISNSGTIGYKRTTVDFSTLVTSQGSTTSYAAGGVQSNVRSEIDKQGLLQGTSSSTDMAIGGNGFFVVSDSAGGADGMMGFTRAGSFLPDQFGNLRNASGYYLQGWRLDTNGTPVVGEPARDSFANLETVNVQDLKFTGAPTKNVTMTANLPAQATGPLSSGTPLSSGLEYFTELGVSERLTFQWTPSTVTDNVWTLDIQDSVGGLSLGTLEVTFSDTGATVGTPSYNPAPPNLTVTDGKITVNANNGVQPIEIFIGTPGTYDGITGFAGDYTPEMTKDGSSFGTVTRVEISEDGTLTAIFNNGIRQPAYRIPVANVPNANGLMSRTGNAFVTTRESGDFYLWDAGQGSSGKISGSTLEYSNVDIAQELTDMIETQRGYSMNGKIITTADQLLQVVADLKR